MSNATTSANEELRVTPSARGHVGIPDQLCHGHVLSGQQHKKSPRVYCNGLKSVYAIFCPICSCFQNGEMSRLLALTQHQERLTQLILSSNCGDSVHDSALRFTTSDLNDTHHCILYAKVDWPSLIQRCDKHLHLYIYRSIVCNNSMERTLSSPLDNSVYN